jgi:uncharacterized protein YggE
LCLVPLTAAAQDVPPNLPVVVTIGTATVQRAPDRAFIMAAVETRAGNPRDAQRQNAEAMTAVHARLAGATVPKDAIRTIGYDVQQEFDYPQGKRVSRGYLARNSIEVKIDDISRVGEILDAIVQAGATTVGGVRFEIADRDGVEREALRLAVADARSRADAAAAGAGRAIDRIIRIEEAREGPIIPMPRMVAMAAERDTASEPPIEPGVIEIRARVTVTAALK